MGDASYLAVAFHEPKRLATLGRDYERSIGLEGTDVSADSDFLARAKAFMENGEQVIGGTD